MHRVMRLTILFVTLLMIVVVALAACVQAVNENGTANGTGNLAKAMEKDNLQVYIMQYTIGGSGTPYTCIIVRDKNTPYSSVAISCP